MAGRNSSNPNTPSPTSTKPCSARPSSNTSSAASPKPASWFPATSQENNASYARSAGPPKSSKVLSQHEPDHPLFEEARRTAKHTYLDTNTALHHLTELQSHQWVLNEIPAVSPFAFGLYASKIRESLMMEDPADAIERLYRNFSETMPDKNP